LVQSDEQAIRDNQAAWLEATARGDLPRILSLMADDVVFLTPGRPPFGREEFAAAFTAGQGSVKFSGRAEFEEIIVAGDVAYARGRIAVTVTPVAGGEAKKLAGYTLSIFRREPDGRWVLARDANLVAPVTGSGSGSA
jgi:uncharacterized protein (TIGR02246 family)